MSLVTIAMTDDVILATRRLRKRLRDVRDCAARADPVWRAVAMAGLVSGGNMLLLIQRHGIDQDILWATLERRWPAVMVTVPGFIPPILEMTVDAMVALVRARRGIEPIRVVIPAQRAARCSGSALTRTRPSPACC